MTRTARAPARVVLAFHSVGLTFANRGGDPASIRSQTQGVFEQFAPTPFRGRLKLFYYPSLAIRVDLKVPEQTFVREGQPILCKRRIWEFSTKRRNKKVK